MEAQNFLAFSTYEDDVFNVDNAIFQAYLQAFFRHQAYIYKLYNTGKISELQTIERINTAWKKLAKIQTKLQCKIKLPQYDVREKFIFVNTNDFCLYAQDSVSMWN
ncbi:hypothetical protein NIES22_60720 [Calothrix brevissima NIES-22]|nr:hypothetical protein NIES22_60720 [Calothrix brevissima NIES-22]